MSKDDRTKGHGFNENINTETKQNETNITLDKDNTTSVNKKNTQRVQVCAICS